MAERTWTPDRMLTYLGRFGIRLDLLDCRRGRVIAKVDGTDYEAKTGQLKLLAWIIRNDRAKRTP